MKVLRGLLDVELEAGASCAVSIGNFDGVHRGHQAVIGSAVAAAGDRGLTSVVCTFDPHTRVFLHPEAPPRLLETLEQRLDAIEALGVDVAVVIPFTQEVATLPREAFVRDFLHARARAVEVHVSRGFTFGAGGRGDVDYLQSVAAEHGFSVHVVPPVLVDGSPVSSTRVREALAAGDVGGAAALLARPFTLVGEVVAGAGRGRGLGAPTANLAVETAFVPANGVYVTEARVADETYPAVTNVGVRPTFGTDGEVVVESHLLGGELALYGERLELAFLDRLRDEMRFETPEALAAQIAEDARRAAAHHADGGGDVRYTAGVSPGVSASGRRRQR